ncbi:kinase inhibitor [Citrobacter sp. L55]|uniref:kinase inhibitor n=1 Tax=Citrobacter sp. L55 TaxID=1981983 RepID=UPI000C7824D7|nr:kinase inhibitor [Citrobacter sp. L55]PLC60660.1 kinase inhibitor [Citrobacter sp. L55]
MNKISGLALGAGLLVSAVASVSAAKFSLSSSDMQEGKPLHPGQFFKGFGCSGGNVSPQLSWKNIPAGTKSFAITVYDPDAPTGSGWWHWTMVNIPLSVTSLPAGAGDVSNTGVPAGAVQGRNDFGYAGFGGACPPEGDKAHRYQFTVWALKTDTLPIDNQSSGALVGFMLNSNVLSKAVLTAVATR